MSKALLALACLALLGCNMSAFAAHGAGRMTARGSRAVEEHWDFELARGAIPSNLMRLEGMHRVVPDDELIMLQLVRAYSAYGYAFLEDDQEVAELAGNYEESDRLTQRAKHMYQRAVFIADKLLRARDDGYDDAVRDREGGLPTWVADTFDDEEDAELLFWCGYARALLIKASGDDPSSLIDLPLVRALVGRSVELDPHYFNAGGLTLLGTLESSVPPDLGGDPERGRALFERALELTQRRALSVQLNYARSYAANTQNRELYESLLREVMDGPDVSEVRFANKIAKRRAARSLAHLSEF